MIATLYYHRCESVWSAYYARLVTNWICQAILWPSYLIGRVLWYLSCCGVSLALARPQWYWLDRNKSSSSLGCMPCINDPETSWFFSLSPSWLWTFLTQWLPWWQRWMVQGVCLIVDYKRNDAYWWLPEELILSGTYQCSIGTGEDGLILHAISWIVGCVWEVVALCLATGIAVKHFRELRRHPAGGIMEDCFMVLIKAHMLYCARWARIVLSPFFLLKGWTW